MKKLKKKYIIIFLILCIILVSIVGLITFSLYPNPTSVCKYWELSREDNQISNDHARVINYLTNSKQNFLNTYDRLSCNIDAWGETDRDIYNRYNTFVVCCNDIFPCEKSQCSQNRNYLSSQTECTDEKQCINYYDIRDVNMNGTVDIHMSYNNGCTGAQCRADGTLNIYLDDGVTKYTILSRFYSTQIEETVNYNIFYNNKTKQINLYNSNENITIQLNQNSKYINFGSNVKCTIDGNSYSGNCDINVQINDLKLEYEKTVIPQINNTNSTQKDTFCQAHDCYLIFIEFIIVSIILLFLIIRGAKN